jgi:hypothetical protein
MSTFGVPELEIAPNNVPDFTSDFDELVRAYIETKYALADPNKATANTIKFKVGFFDRKLPYEIAVLEQDTDPPQYPNGRRRAYTTTGMEIWIRMKRLPRSETEIAPQLGFMEREIQRIAMQYRNQDIPGIKDMFWNGGTRVYNANDEWAASEWRSMIRVRLVYEKVDIS